LYHYLSAITIGLVIAAVSFPYLDSYFTVVSESFTIGSYTWCYQWIETTIPSLSYSYTVVEDFVFKSSAYGTLVIPFSKTSLNHLIYPIVVFRPFQYPSIIDCPVESNVLIYTVTSIGIITTIMILTWYKFLQLESGLHQCFHIPCGQNRTIWILRPTARFGLLKTIWMIKDIRKYLPVRLEPEIVTIPPSVLSPDGNTMYAFSYIDPATKQVVYTYTLAGTHTSACVDHKAYTIIKTWNTDRKKKMTASQFNQQYGGDKKWDPLEVSLAILAVTYATKHRQGLDYARHPSTTHYTFKPDDYEVADDFKPAHDEYFKGCTRGATYIPIKSKGNTAHSIKTRITDVKPTLPPITKKQQCLITEFLTQYKQEVKPTRITGYDEVLERQTRQIQIVSNDEALDILPWMWHKLTSITGKITKSFQKQEASVKPGDPRNITPMPAKVRLENSRISYPLSANMKKTKWYSFGMMPAEIARAVAAYVSDPRTETIGLGDYSRMDGTVNHRVRTFDLAFLYANFDRVDHDFIHEWYSHTYGNHVNAGWGEHYEQGDSQASGDPYTSCLNTARNAFIQFCCARVDLSPKGAYENLGLAAGDDSIQRNVKPESAVKVASDWGFVLKFVTKTRGQPIDYLSRLYSPAVWTGATDSISCPLRLISKFHVSRLATKVPDYVIAFTKAQSVMANDHSTYLLSNWMRKIIRQTSVQARIWIKNASKGAKDELTCERQWASRVITTLDEDKPYYHGDASYQSEMELDVDWQIQMFINEGFDVADMDDFIQWCDDPETDWRNCPVIYEQEAKVREVPYMANGDIVGPCSDSQPDTHKGSNEPVTETPVLTIPDQNVRVDNLEHKQWLEIFKAKVSAHELDHENKHNVNFCKQTFRCKRGDNCKGWYAGLEPCRTQVTKDGKFCRECNKIYRSKRKTN
jgi:hypothetical protein